MRVVCGLRPLVPCTAAWPKGPRAASTVSALAVNAEPAVVAVVFPSSKTFFINLAKGALCPMLLPRAACPSSCTKVANTSSGLSNTGEIWISTVPSELASGGQHSPIRRCLVLRARLEGNPMVTLTLSGTGAAASASHGLTAWMAATSQLSRVAWVLLTVPISIGLLRYKINVAALGYIAGCHHGRHKRIKIRFGATNR